MNENKHDIVTGTKAQIIAMVAKTTDQTYLTPDADDHSAKNGTIV